MNSDYIFNKSERIHLDVNSPIPLYHQIEQIILERIGHPEMVHHRLPPEFELIEIFGVSRATVKKTLENLVNKGLLERRRGIGTHVIQHQVTEDLARLKGYTEEMESRGVPSRTEVLAVKRHRPSEHVREQLQLSEEAETVQVERRRGSDEDFPVVLLCEDFPANLGLTEEDDYNGSLFQLLERKGKTPIQWADQLIAVGAVTAHEAKELELDAGDTVLIIERTVYTNNNQPVLFVRGLYRPDRYQFSIRLKR